MHFVEEIKKVDQLNLFLLFDDGTVRKVPLEEKIKSWGQTDGSVYKQLLNPSYFSEVKLNEELKTIYWDNGVDFCPDMLYQWSEKV